MTQLTEETSSVGTLTADSGAVLPPRDNTTVLPQHERFFQSLPGNHFMFLVIVWQENSLVGLVDIYNKVKIKCRTFFFQVTPGSITDSGATLTTEVHY